MSERQVKEACGCMHNGRRWISECPACAAEHAELHERAQRERLLVPVPQERDRAAAAGD